MLNDFEVLRDYMTSFKRTLGCFTDQSEQGFAQRKISIGSSLGTPMSYIRLDVNTLNVEQ